MKTVSSPRQLGTTCPWSEIHCGQRPRRWRDGWRSPTAAARRAGGGAARDARLPCARWGPRRHPRRRVGAAAAPPRAHWRGPPDRAADGAAHARRPSSLSRATRGGRGAHRVCPKTQLPAPPTRRAHVRAPSSTGRGGSRRPPPRRGHGGRPRRCVVGAPPPLLSSRPHCRATSRPPFCCRRPLAAAGGGPVAARRRYRHGHSATGCSRPDGVTGRPLSLVHACRRPPRPPPHAPVPPPRGRSRVGRPAGRRGVDRLRVCVGGEGGGAQGLEAAPPGTADHGRAGGRAASAIGDGGSGGRPAAPLPAPRRSAAACARHVAHGPVGVRCVRARARGAARPRRRRASRGGRGGVGTLPARRAAVGRWRDRPTRGRAGAACRAGGGWAPQRRGWWGGRRGWL